jgi:hypothetical protein
MPATEPAISSSTALEGIDWIFVMTCLGASAEPSIELGVGMTSITP